MIFLRQIKTRMDNKNMFVLNNTRAHLVSILFCVTVVLMTLSVTQSHATVQNLPVGTAVKDSEHDLSLDKLNDIIQKIKTQEAILATKLSLQKEAKTEQEEQQVQSEIDEISDFIATQESSFEMILTAGFELPKNESTEEKEFNWQKDLLEILQPIMSELRQLTEYRRKLDDLQQEITTYQLQTNEIKQVLSHFSQIDKHAFKQDALEQFELIAKKWQGQLEENKHLLEVTRLQFDEMVKSQTAKEIGIEEHFTQFITGRGATLFLSLVAFISVYFAMSLLWKGVLWLTVRNPNEKWSYYQRVVSLLHHIMMVLLAISAVFYVLSVRNDQVLIALAVLLLVSIVWVLKNSLPRYIDELKILLNTGAVREGEIITYNGIPMKVESLNFYSKLVNPSLPELKLRLPLSELSHFVSRPCTKNEPWFPCQVGDYVMLSDGKYGLVTCITLENILLSLYNSMMPQTYTMQDFLAAQPKNLSRGFIVTSVIGIDYQYQQQCTSQIPTILRDGIRTGLQQEKYGDSLKHIKVYFTQANTSTLDYKIVTIFDGKAAEYYFPAQRALQRYAVEVCNQQQWEIPFTQIVIHDAKNQN